ncbi:MAG: CoA pyrophosphatase [Gammaproteobacteria bacterium]|nr:CoA pyrophosphatase [Gammaproteobacteria bacterium]
MPTITLNTLKSLSGSLTTEHGLDLYRAEHRLAAVLILVYPGIEEPHIILTRRSENLSNHAGQISFPGGIIDPSDPDPVFTALREAREEIALKENMVDVLGILDVALLPSGFAVAPVLAVAEHHPELQANPEEVEEIFSIPLSLACDLSQYNQDYLIHEGQRRDFYVLNYGDYAIWGATAKMLRSLAKFIAKTS